MRRTPLRYSRLEPATPGGSVTTTQAYTDLMKLVEAWEACQATWDATHRRIKEVSLDRAMIEAFTAVMEEDLALANSLLTRLEAADWRSNHWRTTLKRAQAARQWAA